MLTGWELAHEQRLALAIGQQHTLLAQLMLARDMPERVRILALLEVVAGEAFGSVVALGRYRTLPRPQARGWGRRH